jgi:hypothetical protein
VGQTEAAFAERSFCLLCGEKRIPVVIRVRDMVVGRYRAGKKEQSLPRD